VNPSGIVQAARGPLMLITLGALILIDYNTNLKFHRTWPVLIILFGVLKLMERIAGPPPAPDPPPPPAQGYQPEAGYQSGTGFQAGTGFQQPPPPQDSGGTQS
jgi:hypothetical protein